MVCRFFGVTLVFSVLLFQRVVGCKEREKSYKSGRNSLLESKFMLCCDIGFGTFRIN